MPRIVYTVARCNPDMLMKEDVVQNCFGVLFSTPRKFLILNFKCGTITSRVLAFLFCLERASYRENIWVMLLIEILKGCYWTHMPVPVWYAMTVGTPISYHLPLLSNVQFSHGVTYVKNVLVRLDSELVRAHCKVLAARIALGFRVLSSYQTEGQCPGVTDRV